MRCANFFLPNLHLLGYVTFFDILHHYGVIEASLICSVEKVLCRLTEQIFTFSAIRSIEKVLHWSEKSNSRF